MPPAGLGQYNIPDDEIGRDNRTSGVSPKGLQKLSGKGTGFGRSSG